VRPRGSPAVPPGGQDARWVGVVADSVERESPFGWLSRHHAAGTTQLLTGGRGWVRLPTDGGTRHPCRPGLGTSSDRWRHTAPLPAWVGYVFRHMAANGLQLALHQGRPQRLPPPARRPQAAQSGSLTPDELTSTTTREGVWFARHGRRGGRGPPRRGGTHVGHGSHLSLAATAFLPTPTGRHASGVACADDT